MVQTINLYFQISNRTRARIRRFGLYENVILRIEGHIIGFGEYMNLVLDDAEEIYTKTKQRKQVGRILLKGENITLIVSTQSM
uniref:Small nuclear ribonucleoprotein E n=1 Tax=Ixodes ricinus TaxID=34613 RepID=A0A0K8RK16_IXORI